MKPLSYRFSQLPRFLSLDCVVLPESISLPSAPGDDKKTGVDRSKERKKDKKKE